MSDIRVERWVSWEEGKEMTESPLGGLGGWFVDGMRWDDFISDIEVEEVPYAEAFRAAVLERGLKEDGQWHQTSDAGVPVFSDGTTATFSYRAWGDIMAAIWSTAEDRDSHYLEFYMGGSI